LKGEDMNTLETLEQELAITEKEVFEKMALWKKASMFSEFSARRAFMEADERLAKLRVKVAIQREYLSR
jgi:hypothetical protein